MSMLLIDSPYANIANILRALERVGADVVLSADPATIAASSKLVLPGVGTFGAAAAWLDETGVAAAIRQAVSNGASLLGVCVGHQLLFDSSDEMGEHRGLGLIPGRVTRFGDALPVPQIGWNHVHVGDSPLFEGLEDGASFYFVNSYRAVDVATENEIAYAEYGDRFNVAARSGNVFGVQFHPEKSSDAGLRVLRNFVEYREGRALRARGTREAQPRLSPLSPAGRGAGGEGLPGRVAVISSATLEIIPSLDLLRGEVVRLTRGDFATSQSYGTPDEVLQRWNVKPGSRLHLVDLEGSRQGRAVEVETVKRLLDRGFRVQVGGGIRTPEDAKRWIDLGVDKVVTGTVLADSPETFARIVEAVGAERIVASIDVRDRQVRVSGWERGATRSVEELFAILEDLGVGEALVTDISVDGTMLGPAFELYRQLGSMTRVKLIASGGVGIASDIRALSRCSGVSGVVIGRALHEKRFTLSEVEEQLTTQGIPSRVIPCLDVRNGRVVKGVRFEGLRDAGDPVECALRYEAEGADELVVLDVSATLEERRASLDTIRRISENLFIPLTVGGGVKSVDDFRVLLQNGADRVALNSAAVANPQLITDCAREFGVQAVVLAVDAFVAEVFNFGSRRCNLRPRYAVRVRSGTADAPLDAIEWCVRGEELGAGEILLTSIDRDGTKSGFDLELLRAVSSRLKIGVIASGGAGKIQHFAEAIERGGASAVLAASLFHDRVLSIGEVKQSLADKSIDIRNTQPRHQAAGTEALKEVEGTK